jgi:hypothetical protein
MSNTPYRYQIEISNKDATMKSNGNVVFFAKVNKEYFWEIYHITETLTGKTYTVKTFKRSLYYWGTERIEVHNELNELILSLSFKFYMVKYVFFKIFLSAIGKAITLDNPEKKEMI